MRPRTAALAVALAAACSLLPAHAIPLTGTLDTSMAWSPGHPGVGTTVTFTATAADNDGTVRRAQVCFGDGTCATDYPPNTEQDYFSACIFGDNWTHQWTHAYTHSGTFSLTLTVTTRGCPIFDDETRPLTLSIHVG